MNTLILPGPSGGPAYSWPTVLGQCSLLFPLEGPICHPICTLWAPEGTAPTLGPHRICTSKALHDLQPCLGPAHTPGWPCASPQPLHWSPSSLPENIYLHSHLNVKINPHLHFHPSITLGNLNEQNHPGLCLINGTFAHECLVERCCWTVCRLTFTIPSSIPIRESKTGWTPEQGIHTHFLWLTGTSVTGPQSERVMFGNCKKCQSPPCTPH